MKKAIFITVLALFMINLSCGSGGSGSSSSGSTAVTIRLGQSGPAANSIASAVSSSSVPSGITAIRVTVSADDMVTIVTEVSVAGQSSVTVTLDIPNGPNRHILVEALNASGDVLYSGESVVDLGGEPLQLTIVMGPACNLYVDNAGSDSSDCSDVNNPCRTITFALTQTSGNANICVAAGTYNSMSGETFPLTPKADTGIICQGANHSTFISELNVNIIEGAAGALIYGCTITGDPAITDNGTAMTVDNCVIVGSGGVDAYTGIILSADSHVRNSTIRNHVNDGVGIGIRVLSGSPVLEGNTITDNETGIRIFGGTPVISGENTLSCNTSIDLVNSTSNAIDATNNKWDHASPTVTNYPGSCTGGVDICNSDISTGSVNADGSTQASSPCL